MAKPNLELSRHVLHIDLPEKIWRRFAIWCVEQGHASLTAGVKELIKKRK